MGTKETLAEDALSLRLEGQEPQNVRALSADAAVEARTVSFRLPVRSNDQRAQSQPEAESNPPAFERAVELRTDRRELPSIAPVAPAKRPDPNAAAGGKVSRPAHNRRIRWALFALLPIAAAIGADWYVTGGQVMSTDDAYV